jgi:hypothetical protein
MTKAELFKTDLWREFEAAARAEKQKPISVLTELMSDYIESRADSALFDEIAEEGGKSGYTEDDAVDLVRRARLEKMRG